MATLQEKIDALKKKAGKTPAKKARKSEKLNSATKIKRGKNGGARPGAGRPPGGNALARRALKKLLADHYDEKVVIEITDPLTQKIVKLKVPRVVAMMAKLYEIGMKGDAAAIDKWLNRALGKAPQPLIGDEEEDPVRVNLGVDRILDKAYGDGDDEE